MGRIRHLTAQDIPEIAALHRRVGLGKPGYSSEGLAAHFRRVFLEHPWGDTDVASLVYEDDSSRVSGFLGAIPLPMVLKGRSILAAFSSHFMVDPGTRSSLAAVKLMQTFFRGPQDLSLAEGGELPRRIWERLGGSSSLVNSLHWRRPLRPMEYLLRRWGRRRNSGLARSLRPAVRAVERSATGLGLNPLAPRPSELAAEGLTVSAHRECLEKLAESAVLCPRYSDGDLEWIRARLGEQPRRGSLRGRLLRAPDGRGLGWYLYMGNRGELGQVLQIGAVGTPVDPVIDHLLRDAWEQGLVGIGGRLQPMYLQSLVRKSRFVQCDEWVFVHSRHPDLQGVVERGAVYLTHLEGESWMNYGGETANR